MLEVQSIGNCEICGRPLVHGKSVNAHHIIPKTYKGKETILIHVICHTKIHSVLSERELLKEFNTAEKLRAHPEIEKFIAWVKNKDPEFRDRNKPTKARQRR